MLEPVYAGPGRARQGGGDAGGARRQRDRPVRPRGAAPPGGRGLRRPAAQPGAGLPRRRPRAGRRSGRGRVARPGGRSWARWPGSPTSWPRCSPRTPTAPTSRPPAPGTSAASRGWPGASRPAPPRPGSGSSTWCRRTARRWSACVDAAARAGRTPRRTRRRCAARWRWRSEPGARAPAAPSSRRCRTSGSATWPAPSRPPEAAARAGPDGPRGAGPARPALRSGPSAGSTSPTCWPARCRPPRQGGDAAALAAFRHRLAELKETRLLDRDGALALYEEVLAARPDHPETLARLEALLQKDPANDRAAQALERAYAAAGDFGRQAVGAGAARRRAARSEGAQGALSGARRPPRAGAPRSGAGLPGALQGLPRGPGRRRVRARLERAGRRERPRGGAGGHLRGRAGAAAAARHRQGGLRARPLHEEKLDEPARAAGFLRRAVALDPEASPRRRSPRSSGSTSGWRPGRSWPTSCSLQARGRRRAAERVQLLFRLGQLCEERLAAPDRAAEAYEAAVAADPRHLPSLQRPRGALRGGRPARGPAPQPRRPAGRRRPTPPPGSGCWPSGRPRGRAGAPRRGGGALEGGPRAAAAPRGGAGGAGGAATSGWSAGRSWPSTSGSASPPPWTGARWPGSTTSWGRCSAPSSATRPRPSSPTRRCSTPTRATAGRWRRCATSTPPRATRTALTGVYRRLVPLQEDAAGVKRVRLELAEVLLRGRPEARGGRAGQAGLRHRAAPRPRSWSASRRSSGRRARPADGVRAAEARAALLAAQGGPAEAVPAWLAVAELWRAQKRPDAAAAALEKVLELEPGNRTAYQQLRELHAEAGNWRAFAASATLFAPQLRRSGREAGPPEGGGRRPREAARPEGDGLPGLVPRPGRGAPADAEALAELRAAGRARPRPSTSWRRCWSRSPRRRAGWSGPGCCCTSASCATSSSTSRRGPRRPSAGRWRPTRPARRRSTR